MVVLRQGNALIGKAPRTVFETWRDVEGFARFKRDLSVPMRRGIDFFFFFLRSCPAEILVFFSGPGGWSPDVLFAAADFLSGSELVGPTSGGMWRVSPLPPLICRQRGIPHKKRVLSRTTPFTGRRGAERALPQTGRDGSEMGGTTFRKERQKGRRISPSSESGGGLDRRQEAHQDSKASPALEEDHPKSGNFERVL